MCRVCLKRPEIPDERYGRCEACVKGGRNALRFRLGPGRGGDPLVVRAGELAPRALREKWRNQLSSFTGQPSVKAHLGLHEVELLTARDRLDAIRIGRDLDGQGDAVVAALRHAAERSDAAW